MKLPLLIRDKNQYDIQKFFKYRKLYSKLKNPIIKKIINI